MAPTFTGAASAQEFYDATIGRKPAVLKGADRSGTTDSGTVFKALAVEAKNARQAVPSRDDLVAPSPAVIDLNAGVYTIQQVAALLGTEGQTNQTRGFHVRGNAAGTVIAFDPPAAGDLMTNQLWQHLVFEHITFTCSNRAAGSTVYHATNTATSASQDVEWRSCSLVGPWAHWCYLEGLDNNSEFLWDNCSASGLQAGGSVLYSTTTGADQFLNYSFTGCFRLWDTSAGLVDLAKGGHVVIEKLDASRWSLGGSGVMFALRTPIHGDGRSSFICDSLRVEDMSPTSRILYSEWERGAVTLRHVDQSSQARRTDLIPSGYGVKYDIVLNADNNDHRGPILRLEGGQFAGKIKLTSGWGFSSQEAVMVVSDAEWIGATRPSDVVQWNVPSGAEAFVLPCVEFVRCRTEAGPTESGMTGWSTWDALIGWSQNRAVAVAKKREIACTGIWAGPATADTFTFNLPTPALVTGFRALSPAGATPNDTDGGAYVLKSNGAQIATAAVPASQSSGYVAASTMVPQFLDTDAKTTLQVTTTNVAQAPDHAMVIIEGYW